MMVLLLGMEQTILSTGCRYNVAGASAATGDSKALAVVHLLD